MSSGSAITLSVSSLRASSLDAAVNGVASKKVYMADGKVFPTWTAIIHVGEDGNAEFVTFDEGCYLCSASSDQCTVNAVPVGPAGPAVDEKHMKSCYIPVDQCREVPTAEAPEANTCDLKVFVVWTGVDSKGRPFQSAGARVSSFRHWAPEMSSLWKNIKEGASTSVSRVDGRLA